ncbi:hypothetical protein C8R47DRAFT_1134659 [Mycena vitilis]|nr:hypothetical protein C8R47DRAFT_1134659 [Mycena vitilis]
MTPVDSVSLVDLPTELLLEILDVYPGPPMVFFTPLAFREYGVREQALRRQILRSLSQTSVILRDVFLPLLWNTLDVTEQKIQYRPARSSLKALVFPLIENVNVNLTEILAIDKPTIDLLVQFLCALPNVSGLRIRLERSALPLLVDSFGTHTLPTVLNLCVPGWLDPLFQAFPSVTSLTCPAIYHDTTTLAMAQKQFTRLDTLAGISPYKELLEDVLERFPRLRRISTSGPADLDLLPLLSSFRNLAELSLAHRTDDEQVSVVNLVLAARAILQRSESRDRKILRIWEFDMLDGFSMYPRVIHV